MEVSETGRPQPEIVSPTSKKIVVVDDTEMLLISVEDILTNAGPEWQITTARNATEGLQQIKQMSPDLVLLDYSLPDFNGDELCERLLQNERTAEVPVLMMSGHVAEMTAAAARLPNVVAKIEKPFFSDALVDLVRRTLETEHAFEEQIEQEVPAPTIFAAEPPGLLPEQEIAPEPARLLVRPTTLAPAEPHIEKYAPGAPAMVRVAPSDGNRVTVVALFAVAYVSLATLVLASRHGKSSTTHKSATP